MEQQSLIYSFVARGTVILSEYSEFTGDFSSIASQYLQKLPASNNEVTYNFDGRTFNYLVDDGYTYCVVAVESAGRQIPIAFLERIKEEFTKKYGGGKAATAVANSLNREFGPNLKELMQYCVNHPDEISKLSKVKVHVSEVEGVMMENIEKVLDRGEKIELLVDKNKNLRSQCFQEFSLKWKQIVWVVQTVSYNRGEQVKTIATAFSLNDGGLLLLTSAGIIPRTPPYVIMVRKLHEEGFHLEAKVVFLRNKWNIALLKLKTDDTDQDGDDTDHQCGNLAVDGSLSEGQTLLHIGNPGEFIGSFCVGKVAFQCTNDVKLPQGYHRCSDFTSTASNITPKYRMMGQVWHEKKFDGVMKSEKSFERNLNPFVPIIQIYGFGCQSGSAGGPVFDLKGHIVGMISSQRSDEFDIAIHVTILRECLRQYKEEVNSLSQKKEEVNSETKDQGRCRKKAKTLAGKGSV